MATCPGCAAERAAEPAPPLPIGGTYARRITRFHTCPSCGATVRMMAREGWERWYDVDWRKDQGQLKPCADRDAYYARQDARVASTN